MRLQADQAEAASGTGLFKSADSNIMAPWKRFNKSKLSLPDESTDGSSNRSNPGNLRTPSLSGNDLLQSVNSDLQQTIRG